MTWIMYKVIIVVQINIWITLLSSLVSGATNPVRNIAIEGFLTFSNEIIFFLTVQNSNRPIITYT